MPNLELILYAISVYSVGPKIKKDFSDPRFVCASFLIFLDHIDGIGAISFYREINFHPDYDIFPSKGKAEFEKMFDKCLRHPESVDAESKEVRILRKLHWAS